MILKKIIGKLCGRRIYDVAKFKSFGMDSSIGEPLSIFHPEYISIGSNTGIFANARLDCWPSYEHNKLNPNLVIGNRVSIGFNFSAHCTDELIIDDDVLIASYVLLTTQNHGMNPESERSYQRQPLIVGPIHICQGVWIGEKVTVLPGVTIGERSIIGANSVVNRDIPPYCIAAGIPAKIIKKWDFETHRWIRV